MHSTSVCCTLQIIHIRANKGTCYQTKISNLSLLVRQSTIIISLHGHSKEMRWHKIAQEEQKRIVQMADLDQFKELCLEKYGNTLFKSKEALNLRRPCKWEPWEPNIQPIGDLYLCHKKTTWRYPCHKSTLFGSSLHHLMERIAIDKSDCPCGPFPALPAPPVTKTTFTQSPACSPAVDSKMLPYWPSDTLTQILQGNM